MLTKSSDQEKITKAIESGHLEDEDKTPDTRPPKEPKSPKGKKGQENGEHEATTSAAEPEEKKPSAKRKSKAKTEASGSEPEVDSPKA